MNTPTRTRSPTSEAGGHRREHQRSRGGGDALPTAPCSPSEAFSGDDVHPPLPSHERLDMSAHTQPSQHRPTLCYPTPPTSSASSLYGASRDGSCASGSGHDSGPSSHAWSTRDDKMATEALLSKLRRNTFTVTSPASSIVTTSSVHAAHISNPASTHPSSPVVAQSSASRHSSASRRPSTSQSDQEVKKLTENATVPSRHQATPPQTPRTQSHENKYHPSNLAHHKSATGPNAALLGPPKGKLSVFIAEGRGLRPSADPYVVCQFQWSEYISEGPRSTGGAQDGGSSGMPIRRVDNTGRPMAIPMKSRQNSHAGNADSKDSKQDNHVTNPKWEHEAVL